MRSVRKILRDDQRQKLAPLLPGKAGDKGRSGQDNRLFIEAVLWIVRTSSPWPNLPAELGNWHTTYTRFKRWGEAGVWQRIVDAVSHDSDMELLMIDNTIVRAHQHSASAQKKQAGNR